MKKDSKNDKEEVANAADDGLENLEKELKELIDEGESRTEAYKKLIKEIEKQIENKIDNQQ
jgi:hypothetical protein